ncbi:MAG: DUF1015 domain-containing protein [Thermodesulfobacteriota bacterium]
MANIRPFRGLLYHPEKVGELKAVMAPPYDVISPERQEILYRRHPNNIVRLILGKTTPTDVTGSDRYSRAAAELYKWTEEGVLGRDETPAIYYYTQTYGLPGGGSGGRGGRRERKGFIALSRIEEPGKGSIHAHERTLSGPKADRLNLMKACRANFSCIFTLYSDPELRVNGLLEGGADGEPMIGKPMIGSPMIEVADDDGTENRLWRISAPDVIDGVCAAMRKKALFIADGHHRYETALNYRNMMREGSGDGGEEGEEPFDYVMTYFSNMDEEGLSVFPTHRVVHSLGGFEPTGFLKKCGEYFDIEELPFDEGSEAAARDELLKKLGEGGEGGQARFGLRIKGEDRYHLLTLDKTGIMDELFGDAIPEVYKSLDVTVLHSLILDKILGITREAQEAQTNIRYVKDTGDALEAATEDANQLAFIMNPTKVGEIREVSEAGLLMPQKSTYFYPKLLSGLVINPLD